MSELLLHHYWPSPFAQKTRMALGLADLAWTSVEIPRVPPKPLLMPLTAGYRRTPVLQIGADVYCDTHNIALALAASDKDAAERLFPGDTRGEALVVAEWIDQALFPLAVRMVMTESLQTAPADFIQDRCDLYFGPGWTREGLRADLPGVTLQLEAALLRLESWLSGAGPCEQRSLNYGDVAAAFIAWFVRGRARRGAELLNGHPHLCAVEAALGALGQTPTRSLTGAEALAVAYRAQPQTPTGIATDSDLVTGEAIGIRPYHGHTDPEVTGALRCLTPERVSIDHHHPDVGDVAVHFPVAGYQIRAGNRACS